jgi:hypothetical protein
MLGRRRWKGGEWAASWEIGGWRFKGIRKVLPLDGRYSDFNREFTRIE